MKRKQRVKSCENRSLKTRTALRKVLFEKVRVQLFYLAKIQKSNRAFLI